MLNTAIEWAHHTWNVWVGCQKVSPGCAKCYMYREQSRYGNDGSLIRKTQNGEAPLKWARTGKAQTGDRIFVCSWSDFFIEEADPWRQDAYDIMFQTQQFNYLIPTKRIERLLQSDSHDACWPLGGRWFDNIWLGVSIENADYLWRVDYLRQIHTGYWDGKCWGYDALAIQEPLESTHWQPFIFPEPPDV